MYQRWKTTGLDNLLFEKRQIVHTSLKIGLLIALLKQPSKGASETKK